MRRGALQPMSGDLVARVAGVCLVAIGINATLIQTVTTEDSSLKTIIRVAVLGLVVVTIALRSAPLPRWVVLTVLLSSVLMVMGGNPDQLSYIFVLVLAMMLREVHEQRLERLLLVASAVSLALIFAFLAAGVTQDAVLMPRDRHSLGVNSVPFVMNATFGTGVLLMVYVLKYRPRGGRVACLLYLAFATTIFALTDVRGGYVALLLFAVLLIAVPLLAGSALARISLALVPTVSVVGAFVIAARADDAGLNQLLSFRPRLYGNFLERVTPIDSLISQSVKQFDDGVAASAFQVSAQRLTIVDNSYLHLLVGGGVLLTLIFLVAYASAVLELFRRGRHPEIALLTASVIYFSSESLLVRVENIFVIYVWYLVVMYAWRPGNPSGSSRAVVARAEVGA